MMYDKYHHRGTAVVPPEVYSSRSRPLEVHDGLPPNAYFIDNYQYGRKLRSPSPDRRHREMIRRSRSNERPRYSESSRRSRSRSRDRRENGKPTGNSRVDYLLRICKSNSNGGHASSNTLRDIAREVMENAHHLSPSGLGTILAAYANCRLDLTEIYVAVEKQIEAKAHLFGPHEISSVLRSYAKSRVSSASDKTWNVFRYLEKQIEATASQFDTSTVR